MVRPANFPGRNDWQAERARADKRRRRNAQIIAIVMAALLVLSMVPLLGGCSVKTTGSAAPSPGYEGGDGSWQIIAPADRTTPIAAVGTGLDGSEIDLASFRGDVTVVNFWFASCPPCRKEAPDLRDLAAEFADDHVRFLGVNPRDNRDAARAFERKFEITYPTILDNDSAVISAFSGLIPLQAMPSTVVLDRQGRPAARILGQIQPSILRGMIADTLAEVDSP